MPALRFTFFLFVLLACHRIFAQTEAEKPFEKSDRAFARGDYRAALKYLPSSRLRNKNPEPVMLALLLIREGAAQGGMGKFADMNNSLTQSTQLLQNLTDKNPALAWTRLSQAWSGYGNPRLSLEYARKAQQTAVSGADTLVLAQANAQLAQALCENGEIRQAQPLLEKVIASAKNRLNTTEKRSRSEKKEIKTQYLNLLLLKARLLEKKGDYAAANTAYEQARGSAAAELGVRSMPYYQADFYRVRMNEDQTSLSESINAYEKMLMKGTGKAFRVTGKFSMEVHKALMEKYYLDDQTLHAKDLLADLENDLEKYYHKNTIYDALVDEMSAGRFLQSGKRKKAESLMTKTLSGRRGKLPADYVKTQPLVTTFLETLSKNPLAPGSFFAGLETYQIPADHPHNLLVMRRLFEEALADEDIEQARSLLQQYLVVKKSLYNDQVPEWHLAMTDVADFYVNGSENLVEAEKVFIASLPVLQAEMAPQNKDWLHAQTNLARLYDYTDRFEKAKTILNEQAKVVKTNFGENFQYAVIQSNIAAVQVKAAEYRPAEASLQTALAIFKTQKAFRRTLAYARTLQTQARLYTQLGLYDEAEKLLDNADTRAIRKRVRGKATVRSLDDLALLYIRQGRYSEVEEPLYESIRQTEQRYNTTSHRNLILPLQLLATLQLEKGDYVAADKTIRRASAVSTQLFGENSDRNAQSLLVLGQVQAALGDQDKAEQNFRKVMSIVKTGKGENNILSVSPLTALAEVRFEKTKNLKEAEGLLEQAKTIVNKEVGFDSPLYAEVLKKTAALYIESDRLDTALPLLEQANAIWQRKVGRANRNAADVFGLRGDIYAKKKDFAQAETQYNSAKAMYAEIFNSRHPSYKKIVGKLGRMYYVQGNYKQSLANLNESTEYYLKYLKKTFPSLSENEKSKFWNSIRYDFEFYNTLAIKLKEEKPELLGRMYDFQLATKALLLNSSVRVRERILNSSDTLLKARYKEWVTKKELLNTVLSLNTQQMQEAKVNPDQIEQEIEAIERQLSERSEDFAQGFDTKNYTWENVRNQLADNETALEIIRYRHFTNTFSDSVMYVALAVSKETRKYPAVAILGNGRELENKFLKFHRNNIRLRREESTSYQQFWEPVEKILRTPVVYFSPDGVYNQINPLSLRTTDGKYVIDKINLVQVSNTKDLIVSKLIKKSGTINNSATLIGNPAYYDSATGEHDLEALPGAEREVKEISQQLSAAKGWKVDMLVEKAADEETIKKISNPRIFHVATHGFFQADEEEADELSSSNAVAKPVRNPLNRSGLVLKGGGDVLARKEPGVLATENGILTANEIMNMSFDKTECAILSACETGLGEVQVGEGVFGLQRAFLVAGADAVVMSLFKVNDDITQKLMNLFYSKWLVSGNKRQAFLEAQKALKTENPSPLYWGAFVMIGGE
jgi:CHAT domain-containing protein